MPRLYTSQTSEGFATMADTARAVVRHFIMLLCFWLPPSRRKKIERWLRGREEFKKLEKSDWVLMSWANPAAPGCA